MSVRLRHLGTGAPRLDDLTTVPNQKNVKPGPINLFDDLSPVEARLWENPDQDLRFESNAFIQRISISADALFGAGSSELTDKGRTILDSLLPVMAQSAYPLSLSGHTADGLSELGLNDQRNSGKDMDFSWGLSLARVGAVYRYFVNAGLDPEKLRMEAFGRFQPKNTNETPEGRRFNRRVEITLDRRIGSWDAKLESAKVREEAEAAKDFRVWDFIFRFDLPGGRRP